MDFAPSSISLRVRWWIAPPERADALNARDKVLTAGREHDVPASRKVADANRHMSGSKPRVVEGE